ncbi:MAG TPA: protein kinase [Kofleriaceae bacterium]|jgi:serine/threonine-protein kinase
MPCPDENSLAAYADNGLDKTKRAAIEQHIASCDACRSLVSELVRGLADTSDTVLQSASTSEPRNVALNATFRMISGQSGALPPPPSMPASRQTLEPHRMDRQVQLVPGTLVGEYEVTGMIGSGGMGAVFSAVHPRIRKQAAIKVLNQQLARHPAEIVRFENEARAVNEIHHPNIVDIFGFGELTDGTPYFVMERVEGTSLQQWLEKRGALTIEQSIPILMPIFDALTAAHERGVVHRDLKPGNIMIAGSDTHPRIKILDFGLAKMMTRQLGEDAEELTMPGVAMGTPLFMSPEQYLGGQIDHRTDIYALGVIVYQMVCAAYPFMGASPTLVGLQHLVDAAPAPSSIVPTLPRALDEVLLRALAKDPADRYATVAELRDALILCGSTTTTTVPQRAARPVPVAPSASGDVPTVTPGPPVPAAAVDVDTDAVAPLSSPRRRAFLTIGLGIAGSIAAGAISFFLLRTPTVDAPAPVRHDVATEPAPPAVAPDHSASAPVTPPPAKTPIAAVADPTPSEPPVEKAAVPTGKQTGRTGSKNKRVGHTPPKGTTSGSAGTKPPCNPYKSADGC